MFYSRTYTVRYVAIRYDTGRYGTIRGNTVRNDTAQNGKDKDKMIIKVKMVAAVVKRSLQCDQARTKAEREEKGAVSLLQGMAWRRISPFDR